ncbi:diversity-generating retroelement protein bAvd family protein [Echinicola strongylocentroti]|uniref:Diversity-generating retroelement protein bAvd family protein n=1 Tax=Echinicola strongylocentroti TaxID=1795355 RepID=A0A2Z4IJ67_9BACT|nr:four helix bundle protein [Echinicola strongylocentroti]AWW30757.1 diversity-generating retroelement protein bAvd family protein [Echinicola strongylocentroti]
MHNFRNLKVWQKSVDFAVKIYLETKEFPKEEKFGMVSQMRRARVSVPSNIAEGSAKSSGKAFSNSLEISLGESYELETQLEISKRVGLLDEEKSSSLHEDLVEIQRMINGLKSKVES